MFRLQHTQRERLLRCGAVLALLFAVVSAKESVAEQPARHQHTPVSEEIPLLKVGGVYALPVEINAVLTLRFVLDSGATDVQIPADAALTLYRTRTIRETDFLPGQLYVLADGSTVRSSRFLLRSLTVGRQRLTDVPASIGSPRSVPLLGQSFLKRLATWSIDNQRAVLMVTAPASGAPSAQEPASIRPDGRATPSPTEPPTTLLVRPLRLSSQVAQVGQRLTVELEAINTSKRPGHGMVLLHYPEHLVSFMALRTGGQDTPVQFPASNTGPPAAAAPPTTAYQLLWSHWPSWTPGERRTAIISLVPRLPQDMTLHVSVVFEDTAVPAASQRWSSVVRIPFRTAVVVERHGVRSTPPRQ
jgi:predicted aspartyl protease